MSSKSEQENLEGKKIISEFIVPKFVEIRRRRPICYFLVINFRVDKDGFYYTSSIDSRTDSPYSEEAIIKAVEFIEDKKICFVGKNAKEHFYSFYIDLYRI